MKTFQSNPVKFLILAIACMLLAGATTEAGAPNGGSFSDNARLIVWRAADFGTDLYLNVYINGVQITSLGRNERYEAIVRPGYHILSIGTSPSAYGKTKFTYRRVTMSRGQTYAFTALWLEPDRATLETAGAALRPPAL